MFLAIHRLNSHGSEKKPQKEPEIKQHITGKEWDINHGCQKNHRPGEKQEDVFFSIPDILNIHDDDAIQEKKKCRQSKNP